MSSQLFMGYLYVLRMIATSRFLPNGDFRRHNIFVDFKNTLSILRIINLGHMYYLSLFFVYPSPFDCINFFLFDLT